MKHTKEEEFQLIKDILGGQQELYRKLVDRYAPIVFHIVRKFEKDEDEVEELAQQIFVKAYERLDSFDMKSRYSSWLFVLAKNHCRDYARDIRRKKKRFSEMDEQNLEMYLVREETPEHLIVAQQWQEVLDEALNKITSDYAQAFLFKYRDNMTYQAMAEKLNVTVSALKVRVHRGRKELIEYIRNRYSDSYE